MSSMIIDGHAHACGEYLKPESIIKNLNRSGVDKVVLVPGELNSGKTYGLPNLAELFPQKNVAKFFNLLTGISTKLTGAVNDIPAGNEYVYELKRECRGRVIQFVWITRGISSPIQYLESKYSEWQFKGIKIHQCWEKVSIDSNYFKNIAAWAEEKRLPLFIHLSSDYEVRKLISYRRVIPD